MKLGSVTHIAERYPHSTQFDDTTKYQDSAEKRFTALVVTRVHNYRH